MVAPKRRSSSTSTCLIILSVRKYLSLSPVSWELVKFFMKPPGFATEQQSISEDVIKSAFRATEEGFQAVVEEQWPVKPQIAAVGSCCLVGVISAGHLYIGNAGDSRVVLCSIERSTGGVIPVQLSVEHNAGIESVRKELRSLHPNDPQIVVLKHNVWRVKGLIQVGSRSTAKIDKSVIIEPLRGILGFSINWRSVPEEGGVQQGAPIGEVPVAPADAEADSERGTDNLRSSNTAVRSFLDIRIGRSLGADVEPGSRRNRPPKSPKGIFPS